jgi:predicted acylesterase/phospholipase RssA
MDNGKFVEPTEECDLIMQGGITSGVVYPMAVLKLAPRYRFRCIGGTSAGAIAAAVTAAAELGRAKGGFEKLQAVPEELTTNLQSLFQPVRPFKGVFALFMACLGNRSILLKIPHVLFLLLWHFLITTLVGLLPVGIYVWRTWGSERGGLECVAIVAAGLASVFLAWLGRLLWLLFFDLPRKDFGVCRGGVKSGASARPALTEWITDLLDRLAGTQLLTFGDLDRARIELKMMTTNLSSRRPYSLPFVTQGDPEHEGRYAFCEKEWDPLFPRRVMDRLRDDKITKPVPGHAGYRYLPEAGDLPVVVAVRLSLSFPVLLAAVPLHRQDWAYRDPIERAKLRRCVFSDGGISSNFPIHFFDRLLPLRPTFAIALEAYSPLRSPSEAPEDRVYMPQDAGGFVLPIEPVDSLLGFVGAIVDSARTWQDNLQRILSGYRERTARIALTDVEGGLNLNMSPDVMDRLTGLGGIAGDWMLKFDLQEHQWRRFLVAYARLEESLEHMNDAYAGGFEKFLNSYPPNTRSYKVVSQAWLNEARDRLAAVLSLSAGWKANPLRTTGRIPKPDTDLRITPNP